MKDPTRKPSEWVKAPEFIPVRTHLMLMIIIIVLSAYNDDLLIIVVVVVVVVFGFSFTFIFRGQCIMVGPQHHQKIQIM